MNKTPIVSIILPTYNYFEFLKESLEKLKLQTLINWECIIIDDGSTDKTGEKIAEVIKEDSRFIYIYQLNQGVSAARNLGLAKAKGKYIQFLDADDYIEAEKLDLQVKILEKNPEIDILYGDEYDFWTNEDNIIIRRNLKIITLSDVHSEKIKKLLELTPFATDNPLFRSNIFQEIGGFDEDLDIGEDWLLWSKIIFHNYNIRKYIGKPLIHVRQHSTNKKIRNYVKSQKKFRNTIAGFLTDKKLQYQNKKYMYWFIIGCAKQYGHSMNVIIYSIKYFLFAFPKYSSDFKIFIGDILFPEMRKLIKGK